MTGITTAMVSRNAVASHCAALGVDAKLADRRDGDVHDGLVEHHDEGRDQQQVDDQAVAGGDAGGLGRGVKLGRDGFRGHDLAAFMLGAAAPSIGMPRLADARGDEKTLKRSP